MATLRQIRRRIRSIQNTAKITKAMELVAASKMRRAQMRALADDPAYEDTRPIARLLMEEYVLGEMDRVYLVYPLFVNTMTQRPQVQQLLPVEPPQEAGVDKVDYIYEPSAREVLAELLPRYVEMLDIVGGAAGLER